MRAIPTKSIPRAATSSPSVMLRRTGLLDKSDGGRVISSPRSLRLAAPKAVVAQQIMRRTEPRTQTPRRPRGATFAVPEQPTSSKKISPKLKAAPGEDTKVKLAVTKDELNATKEELQATLAELEESRASLSECKEKYASALETIKTLEEKSKEQTKELAEITNELIERRRKSSARQMLGSLQNGGLLIDDSNDKQDENLENIMLLQAQKKITSLCEELQSVKLELQKNKEDNKSLLKDMLVVVRVAQSQKEEAQSELTRMQHKAKSLVESDEVVWRDLMKTWNSSSRRNALLAWTQEVLMAYLPLSVTNFSSDWEDGKLFCALIHHCRPDLLKRMDLQGDCEDLAVTLAEQLDIKAITASLFQSSVPDWRQVMIAVFQLYKLSQSLEN